MPTVLLAAIVMVELPARASVQVTAQQCVKTQAKSNHAMQLPPTALAVVPIEALQANMFGKARTPKVALETQARMAQTPAVFGPREGYAYDEADKAYRVSLNVAAVTGILAIVFGITVIAGALVMLFEDMEAGLIMILVGGIGFCIFIIAYNVARVAATAAKIHRDSVGREAPPAPPSSELVPHIRPLGETARTRHHDGGVLPVFSFAF